MESVGPMSGFSPYKKSLAGRDVHTIQQFAEYLIQSGAK
jgi:hypothetical protein